MRPGDKVRFLHSTGDGIVRNFVDNKTVEVEIEDGFIIPVLKSELVVISAKEASVAGNSDDFISEEKTQAPSNSGTLFAFQPFNEQILSLYLINDRNEEILFTIGEEKNNTYSGVFSTSLPPYSSIKISEYKISEFEKWPEFIIQILYFKKGISELKDPYFRKIKFKAESFFKNKSIAPLLNKEAYLFNIDQFALQALDPKKLVESFYENKNEPAKKLVINMPSKEVDLHIENLVADFSKMSNGEILELQLKTFEMNLENAIAMDMDEIVFIHGIGNGVLKQNIHKSLSQNKNIQFFQDARKEKFGYGATLVKIK